MARTYAKKRKNKVLEQGAGVKGVKGGRKVRSPLHLKLLRPPAHLNRYLLTEPY